MVNVKYIHEKDNEYMIETMYNENKTFFEECECEISLLKNKWEQNRMFMESSIDTDEVIYEGVTDVLKKIGEKITEIIKKCIQFVEDGIQKMKEFSWKHKDQRKVLNKLREERPDIADRVQLMVDQGKLSIHDFNDINHFYKDIGACLDELEKGDPESAEAKAIRAKERFEKASNVVITTGKVVAAVSTVAVGVSSLIKFLGKNNCETNVEIARKEADKYGLRLKKIVVDENGAITKREFSESVLFESKDEVSPNEKLRVASKIANILDKTTRDIVSKSISCKTTLINLSNRAINMCKAGEKK